MVCIHNRARESIGPNVLLPRKKMEGDVYMVRGPSFGLYIYPMRMPNLTGGNYFGQLNSPFCPVQLHDRWLFNIPRWQPFLLISLWVDLWSFIHLAIIVWYFRPFPLCVYYLGKLYQEVEDFENISLVGVNIWRLDENIIQIDYDRGREHIPEDIVHKVLENGWGITEPKGITRYS
ncbi:unnamed protein product [Ranitomeya imitator]|uniref:Uncharacterized protein n=1 Tax=Ranitomeya imitator TaxID=111125 RepID=A0ABN9M5P5_9NEOB|nr:unnamed protein product [Ranitomeya imitator]